MQRKILLAKPTVRFIHFPQAALWLKPSFSVRSFCLSLYGSALRSSSSTELRSLETTYNNILGRIWSLPHMCHTGILHRVAQLDSIYNIVIQSSSKLLSSALRSHSSLVCEVFSQSSRFVNSSLGYNTVYGSCLLYTSPSPRDATLSRMPSSA